ncbi:cytoplasmic protein [Mesobacillus subterraneus]|uniref:Cytoplasmic protein n=2 Tax=Mesobacillus subterraneus TaxID=285983 RepID=A0A0D6ZC24_9BACI|nr:cytoplasmic protein [Mesobacillus subterraneus]
MLNNDILIRLRYALDIKDTDMVEMFRLGGVDLRKDDVQLMLKKVDEEEDDGLSEDYIRVNNAMMEQFLNGLVTFKRGKRPGENGSPPLSGENVNNQLLKKLKIALSLTSEDMLGLLELAGVRVSKGELSAILRKAGHKNYRECGDKFARNFLKGLTLKYRE